jgi:hypothetical protein
MKRINDGSSAVSRGGVGGQKRYNRAETDASVKIVDTLLDSFGRLPK